MLASPLRHSCAAIIAWLAHCATTAAFVHPSTITNGYIHTTGLRMGLFDGWNGGSGGTRNEDLDEEWRKQKEILKLRNSSKTDRDKYFREVEERRMRATKEQTDKWAWQTKNYGKGEDPINEWRKRRESGQISDLDNQYGDPKEIGGIPLPGASFGVGGEFGVGGKFDNGGRFDLRLPYADQGYVDENADFMGKLTKFFGGKKEEPKEIVEEKPKKKKWPWEQ